METAFLVETGPASNPRYLALQDRTFYWTPDPNAALRFARKADGDKFRALFGQIERVAEHAWQ